MKTEGKYILEGKTVKPCHDLMEWAKWFETAERHVREDKIGAVRISTVFLGMDHAWGGGRVRLFETMIFGGMHDGYCERCSTWEGAEEMHEKALKMVKD